MSPLGRLKYAFGVLTGRQLAEKQMRNALGGSLKLGSRNGNTLTQQSLRVTPDGRAIVKINKSVTATPKGISSVVKTEVFDREGRLKVQNLRRRSA